MSTHAASAPATLPAESAGAKAGVPLSIGLAGIAATIAGIFVSGVPKVAASWLLGMTFWTGLAIGMLLLVMIHHIVDASWSVVIRRQWEHGLAAFKWLGLLFTPLLVVAWYSHAHHMDLLWPWMNPEHALHGRHGTVATDVLYLKKSGFLNVRVFIICTIGYFLVWTWLAARLRKASFSQDADGDPKWTHMNRRTAAFGIVLTAFTLTGAAIHWVKSLEYHWFSTMYGVWFFANCVRGALSVGVLLMVWLHARGDYRGILTRHHLHSIGQLIFAFTVFWAYVTFSQYFLIWNANVPEETFWYTLREYGDWYWVGMLILFGHFFVPFLCLLSYRNKIDRAKIKPVAWWILLIILVDLYYNIMPFKKDEHGDPVSFLSSLSPWDLTALVGIGGICAWAYLKSFATTKLIPIRDPRITECLHTP